MAATASPSVHGGRQVAPWYVPGGTTWRLPWRMCDCPVCRRCRHLLGWSKAHSRRCLHLRQTGQSHSCARVLGPPYLLGVDGGPGRAPTLHEVQHLRCQGRTRIPLSPPVGKAGEKVIIIHLAGYEDWSPSSRRATGSGTSFEHGRSGPNVVPFAWAHGVLDGRPAPAPCTACPAWRMSPARGTKRSGPRR